MKIKNNILAIAVLTLILTGCETISSGTKSDESREEEEKVLKLGDINVANSNSRLAFDFEEVNGAKEYHFKLVDSLGETWMEDEKYEPKTVVNIEQLPPGSYLPYLKAVAMEKYKDSEWTSSKISFNVSRVEIGNFAFLYDSREMLFSPFIVTENEDVKNIKMRFSWSQDGEYKNKDFDITNEQELDLSSFKTNTQYTLSAKIETENVLRSMAQFVEVGGLFIPEAEKEETPKDFSLLSNGTIHYRDESGLKEAQLTLFDFYGNESYVKKIQNDELFDLSGIRDGRYKVGLQFLGNGKGITDSDFAFLDEMLKVGNVGLEERVFEISQIIDGQNLIKVYFNFEGSVNYKVDVYKKENNQKMISENASEQVFEFIPSKEMGTGEYEIVAYAAADSVFAQKTVKRDFEHRAPLIRVKKKVKKYMQITHGFYKKNMGTVWYTDYEAIQESENTEKTTRSGYNLKQIYTKENETVIDKATLKKRTIEKSGNGSEKEIGGNKYFLLNNYSREQMKTRDDYPVSSLNWQNRYDFDKLYDNYYVFDSTRAYCAFWAGIFITDFKPSEILKPVGEETYTFENSDKIGTTIEESGTFITNQILIISSCGIKYNSAVGSSFEALFTGGLFNGEWIIKWDESYIYSKGAGYRTLELKEFTVTTLEAV